MLLKWVGSALLVGALMGTSFAAQTPLPKGRVIIQPFNYHGVKLEDGSLKRQFDEVRNDYLRLPNDDLLKGFRERSGNPAPGCDMGGWYTADIGNAFGQYVSGLSRMYAATGDIDCKNKVIALVHEWGKCIGPDGYGYYSRHVPGYAYNYDKTVGGLVDAYIYCGDDEAIGYLSKFTDWAIKNLNRVRDYANADGENSPRVGWSEWYTLGENLNRAYLATGDTKYCDFAEVWEYSEYWNTFAKNGDIFAPRANGETQDRYHAYSHVNTFASCGSAYLVKGEQHYLDTLKNAYDFLQKYEVFATGGYGPAEGLIPHDRVVNSLKDCENNFETQCGSWAGFKMSEYLMSFTGDAKYGDWIEKLLYNGIGASIPTNSAGQVFYYSNYNVKGGCKWPYNSPWSCCSGTRPIAVAAYHDLIYFKDADNLYVNLYTPATVTWERKSGKVVVSQSTKFPETPETQFTVTLDRPAKFGIKLRVPDWLASPMSVSVNGKHVEAKIDANHWLVVAREWKNGDVMTVTLPMKFWVSRIDATNPYPAAIMYGPVTMAVRSVDGNPASKIDLDNLDKVMVPSAGEPLTYHLASDANILVRPFYIFREGEPYFIYLDPSAVVEKKTE